jgi:hypothetical protein
VAEAELQKRPKAFAIGEFSFCVTEELK